MLHAEFRFYGLLPIICGDGVPGWMCGVVDAAMCLPSRHDRLQKLLAGVVLITSILLLLCAQRAEAVELTRSPYNAAVVTETASGTHIEVPDRPAGVFYRATLDPDRTYLVRIRGQATARSVVMRVGRDGELGYGRAPTGLYAFRVTGVEELELLLFRHYATDDESYLVREITVTQCDACPGDAQLRQQILDDRPALVDALAAGDTYAAAVEVMRWAAPRTPVIGGSPAPLLPTPGLSAAEMYYDNFASGLTGVLCSGASDFLVKLLALFDIEATEFDFGDPAVFTHATVIVAAQHDGAKEWYMLDPTYSARMVLKGSGLPVPLLETLELWRSGNSALMDVDDASISSRRIVYDPDANGVPADLRCADASSSSGWSGCGLEHLQHDYGDVFQAAGYGLGQDAMWGLLAFGELFSSEYFGTPPELLADLARFITAVRTSDPDTHVADLPFVPRLAGEPPSLVGTPQVGATLHAGAGAWTVSPGRWDGVRVPAERHDLAVRWHRCTSSCVPIDGAHEFAYTVQDADRGTRLLARVTAQNRWGRSDPLDTPLAAVVPDVAQLLGGARPALPAPASRSTPPAGRRRQEVRIAGRAQVGRRLRCLLGGSNVRRRYTVTWTGNGRRLTRGRTYLVRRRDVGTRLTCKVMIGRRSVGTARARWVAPVGRRAKYAGGPWAAAR